MSVNALVYRVDAGRVIATWSRDALQDAIVETVLEAGQITIRKLLTIADILIEILLAKIQYSSILSQSHQLLQSTWQTPF